MCCKVLVGKGSPIVTEELLWDYTMGEAHRVVGQLGLQRCVGAQMTLELNVGQAAGVIHKDASTLELVLLVLLSVGVEQSSWGAGDEVIDRHLLAREQVVGLQTVPFCGDRSSDRSRHGLSPLFGKLTGRAHRSLTQLCCSCLETSRLLTGG